MRPTIAIITVFLAILAWRFHVFIMADCDIESFQSESNPEFWRNKIVWITGASSGIGKELAIQLDGYGVGVKLILSARREAELKKVAETLSSESFVVPLDLEDLGSLDDRYALVIEKFGHVDVLVNNGGISTRVLAEDADMATDIKLMNVNYMSYVKLSKLVLKSMIPRRSGRIINISSLAGKLTTPLRTAYSASKFAILGFFGCLRLEVLRYDIHVHNILPGSVRTNIAQNAISKDGKKFGSSDKIIDNGMTVERSIEILLNSVVNNIPEVWMFGNAREKYFMYVQQYMPGIANILLNMMNEKMIQDADQLVAQAQS